MANTMTETAELKIESLFVDGDTRTMTLKNPKDELSSNDIADLEEFMQNNSVIIGDKYGGAFGKILTAKKVNKITVNLDLVNPS